MPASRPSLAPWLLVAACASPGSSPERAAAQPSGPSPRVEVRRAGDRLVVTVQGPSEDPEPSVAAYHAGGPVALTPREDGGLVASVPPGPVAVVARVGDRVAAAGLGAGPGPALVLAPGFEVLKQEGETRAAVVMVVMDRRGNLSRHVPLRVRSEGGRLLGMRWVEPGVAVLDILPDGEAARVEVWASVGDLPEQKLALPVERGVASELSGPPELPTAPVVSSEASETRGGERAKDVAIGAAEGASDGSPSAARRNPLLLGGGGHVGVDTWGRLAAGGLVRFELEPHRRLRVGGIIRQTVASVGAASAGPPVQGDLSGSRHLTDVMVSAVGILGRKTLAWRLGGGVGGAMVRDRVDVGGIPARAWGTQLVADARAGALWRPGRRFEVSVDVGVRASALSSAALWRSAPVRAFLEVVGAWSR
jgi:hypothetical protein